MISLFSYIRIGLVLLFLQTFFFRNLYLGPWFIPFPYVYLLCILYPSLNRNTGLLTGFILGLVIDMFYNSTALHALASSFIMFLRPFLLDYFMERKEFDAFVRIRPEFMGAEPYWAYITSMFILHHILLFALEWFRWDLSWIIIFRSVSSAGTGIFFVFALKRIFLSKLEP